MKNPVRTKFGPIFQQPDICLRTLKVWTCFLSLPAGFEKQSLKSYQMNWIKKEMRPTSSNYNLNQFQSCQHPLPGAVFAIAPDQGLQFQWIKKFKREIFPLNLFLLFLQDMYKPFSLSVGVMRIDSSQNFVFHDGLEWIFQFCGSRTIQMQNRITSMTGEGTASNQKVFHLSRYHTKIDQKPWRSLSSLHTICHESKLSDAHIAFVSLYTLW